MSGPLRFLSSSLLLTFACVMLAGCSGCASDNTAARTVPQRPTADVPAISASSAPVVQPISPANPVMLGIDVLEAQGFAALRGKRVGLLTHPAGVNRRGESTIDVLRRAPQVNLVALYGPEHGIYGNEAAEVYIANRTDTRTGLPVYSLYNSNRKPTPEMLRGLDAFVVDLQDIGTRSYTYVSCMRLAMQACFEQGIEFVVLDRPNPLGGLKVSGPPLDPGWTSYVGAFRVPYVHGLTIGELARLCREAPGVLGVDETTRAAGRLTVIPMQGWARTMRWPETGLRWVPTSPAIPDFAAVVGYPMVGLGTYLGKFKHGIGPQYPFRGIAHLGTRIDVVEARLRALNVPGIGVRRVNVTDANGRPTQGLYLEVTDWEAWQPTDFNFYLMRLACAMEPVNPFAAAPRPQAELFIKHMGSEAFFNELVANGAATNVEAWLARWHDQAAVYQQQSQRFWIYR